TFDTVSVFTGGKVLLTSVRISVENRKEIRESFVIKQDNIMLFYKVCQMFLMFFIKWHHVFLFHTG
ncbi:hypothetical protein AIG00_24015, partial [Salmonella enterica subsp. enterica]|nr:hypothetical protein [Salmonella enterica subsp. enterica serovar Enteritidis]